MNIKYAAARESLEMAGVHFSNRILENDSQSIEQKVTVYKQASSYFLEQISLFKPPRFIDMVGYLTRIRYSGNDAATHFYLKTRFLGEAIYFVNEKNDQVVDFEGLVNLKGEQTPRWLKRGTLFKALSPALPKGEAEYPFLMAPSVMEITNKALLFPTVPGLAAIKPSSIKIVRG